MEFLNFTENIVTLTDYIDILVSGNEFAAGALIAGGTASIIYICKETPLVIYDFLVKHTTTTLTVNNDSEIFYKMSDYFKNKKIIDSSRYIKLHGEFDSELDKIRMDIGYGTQVFWLNWYTPIMVISEREEQSHGYKIKETIIIKKLGRSHNLFKTIFSEISSDVDYTKTKFYDFKDGYKTFLTEQNKRTFDSLFLPVDDLKSLIKRLDDFSKNEDWYIENQIPYQLGILLHGVPGTGKTSVCKAIAAHLNKNICLITTEEQLVNASKTIKNSILVVEEIDTFGLSNRIDTCENTKKQSIGLGMVLSAIDGLISNHGRILIMTTNHIDSLDTALIRPGRIDISYEFKYMTDETFREMLGHFFKDEVIPNCIIKNNVSPASVQNEILKKQSLSEIISKFSN